MTRASEWDTWWVANRAAPATYVYFTYVQSSLGDMDAATVDRDWETVVAAAAEAVTSIGYCLLVLRGLEGNTYDGEVAIHLADARPGDPMAEVESTRRSLPEAVGASREQAETARAAVRRLTDLVVAELPSALPTVRASDGFFPSVRIAKDYENLRKRLGLPPLDWIQWLH
ncbi:hypothetical protein [Micromonospora sp. NPDC051141]|uniref:hypothetical protein n=1 Tax=Micromonospora sp. NPDC051141 TaxID=3364284 RepID=UPI0037B57C1D